ncbi:MAG: GNAT family N-acetyltransferase [Aquificaceae bacterium]|nr:MAG: GNAT family N-acetyltransferase [Aquificaceae bacterium]
MSVDIFEADLNNPKHAEALVFLLNQYAQDPMGGNKPLSEYTQQNLVTEIKKRTAVHVILAFVNDTPAGLINAIEGFSTFACKPLLNIHDVMVDKPFRGQGLSRKMFTKVEQIAHDLGCCKLTLEVLDNNTIAKTAYKNFGFQGYQLVPECGQAVFMEKKLIGLGDAESS